MSLPCELGPGGMPIDVPRGGMRTPGVYAGIGVNFVRTPAFFTGVQWAIAPGAVGEP